VEADAQQITFDETSRPMTAPVEEAELDGEMVLYNPVDHRIHHLDPRATIVWQLFDGDATIGELAADIADVFDTPVDTVTADLITLAEDLHGEGLLVDSSSGRLDPYPADHLSDPPNPCDSDAGRLQFGDWLTVRLADRDVALRTSPALSDPLRELLVDHHVDTDPTEVGAHFSAYLPGDLGEVNRLYHGFCPMTRSVDPARVLRSLVGHAAMALPAIDGAVSLFARAAIIDGERAVILPHLLDPAIQTYDARLRQRGIVLTDAPVLDLDLERCEVVLRDHLGLGSALDDLVGDLPRRRREPPPADGRYPISQWWFVHYLGEPGPASRAQAARRAAQVIDPGHDLDGAFFQRLALFFGKVDAQVGDMQKTNPLTLLLGPG
jgi:hypothetical protein